MCGNGGCGVKSVTLRCKEVELCVCGNTQVHVAASWHDAGCCNSVKVEGSWHDAGYCNSVKVETSSAMQVGPQRVASVNEHARQMATLVVVVAATSWRAVWKAFLFSKIIKFLRSRGQE